MKGKRIAAFIIMVILVVAGIVLYKRLTAFEYNDAGDTGNTNGNLYNEGMFCEYEGEVYFVNPYDKNTLYKMNMDGTEFEKLSEDNTSYINICNGYIYYKKFNSEQNKDTLFHRALYGIVRMDTDGENSKVIHEGKLDCMTLCGNYIYYRHYDDDTLFSLSKIKIDGEEDKKLNDAGYEPVAVYKNELYFSNVENNRNLFVLNTENDMVRMAVEGNMYMPDVYEGELYYIDLDNDRAFTKMNLSTQEKTVLSSDKVINYNMSGKYGVIYYQVENDTSEHRLCRMSLNGENQTVVSQGNYSKIGITEKYTYFYQEAGETVLMYRTPTTGAIDVQDFRPKIILD